MYGNSLRSGWPLQRLRVHPNHLQCNKPLCTLVYRTGNVFHLMGALSEFGKLGVTSIGDSREEAQAIYDRVERVLDQETQLIHSQDASVGKSSLPLNWV